jgi:hypothetical protein
MPNFQDVRQAAPRGLFRALPGPAFARHGRPFKSTDLSAFFYGPPTDANRSDLLPLNENAGFTEKMLDDVDRATVKAILAEMERRKR